VNHQSPSSAGPQNASLPVVVIVGGGFGGISAARALKDTPVRVILLDRTNHHLFQPLLYQVATAGLSPADIAKPIRSVLRDQENTTVIMSEVLAIQPERREVVTQDGAICYDHLIVATGARHSYFGHDEWESLAPGLKSLHDAIGLRRRILTAFEEAEKSTSPEVREAFLTFVVVGGGPTGVEMAGAIAELAHKTLARDFRHIDPRQTRVILVEAGPRVLPAFDESLSASAGRQLENLNVEVRINDPVLNVEDGVVTLKSGKIPCHTVVWAAGNAASPLARQIGCETDKAGRAKVNRDLTVSGRPEIQAIGDMVALTYGRDNKPVPGLAPAAMQMGRHAAANIRRQLEGKPTRPFKYLDKGSLATIGRLAGVGDIRGLRFSGPLAWAAWAFVHLYFLIGFRNRVLVFIQWAWAYFTYGRGARLISEPPPPLDPQLPNSSAGGS